MRRSSATADADPPFPSRAQAADRPRSDEQPSLSGQNPRPILRPIAAGELQLRGRFRAIECGPGGIFLLIETNAGAIVRLQVKTLTDVDFITYRTDTPGQVNCGVVEPHPCPCDLSRTQTRGERGGGRSGRH